MKRTLLLSIATLAFSGLLAAPGFAQNPNTQGAGPGKDDPAIRASTKSTAASRTSRIASPMA